jgi:hypothetical protein
MKNIVKFILYILSAIVLLGTFGLGTMIVYQMAIQVSDALGVIALGVEGITMTVLFFKLIY